MLKNPWDIEDIKFKIDNQTEFLRKFVIYDDSNLIQSSILQIEMTNDFVNEIQNSKINTEIMITSMKINSISIYLFILDDRIFIIKRINLPKLQEYFNAHLDSFIFKTSECKEDFFNAILSKDQFSEQNDQNMKEQKDINKAIQNEIILSTIKKSQYRTIKMRQEILPDKFNSKNDQNYKIDDFIQIQSQGFKLYYNSKDQILNVLKYYEDEKRFKHEINFYHQIENTFPFIRKIFGIIKQNRGLPIIILEYVKGERLDNFVLNSKKIDFNIEIKIIEEILFSVYYVHSNGFFLRDLKPGNIIIDSQNDAILIDFDSSKEMYSSNEEEKENTCDIGNFIYTAPEQQNSKEYTYKVDSYSIGMIIHFIISRQKYNFSYEDLSKIYERKENISKHSKFPKLLKEYEFIISDYEKCFETSPILRPSIPSLIEHLIFDNNYLLKRSNEAELPHIINKLEKYESIFKISDKYMHEKPVERSYLQYLLGYIYLCGKYVLINIYKAIIHLIKSSNRNNSDAQYLLGFIYYKGEYISVDINKSIHYFTLSANQNNSDAQYYLGLIYYLGKYISRDINKSIHYFTLSANQNNSDAQYYLGLIYYLGKYISRDINKSIHYFTLSANQNNSDAQYYLGLIYYLDEYISVDINKSIHYFTLSANQNNSDAQYYLGLIYYLGKYISVDFNKSIHYFTLSANQNNSDAQFLLGIIYYKSKHISLDIDKSIHYLTLSANQNNSDAQYYIGLIYYVGQYISRDINKSIHYLTLSANQNNSDAQYLLGFIYYSGKYISVDINKSIHYFTLSANQNNSDAQYLLGLIYYLGKYISRDINKSIHYFTLSANQNNSDAQYLLGLIYYSGKYISVDINKSIHYLTLSANQNNSDAQYLLGGIFYLDEYISVDIDKSIHYFTLSANQNNSHAQRFLGEIYFDGKYIEKNIEKSIYYFKESSCFYNSIAKNYLGIIYKNGDGVEKNIYFAKIYLKEAIKQKEESYSMYNLARIYYFGIDHERKISKAISLLTQASKKQLSMADLFLFYIFSNCDIENFLNQRKSCKYKNKCQKQFSLQMNFINLNNYNNIQMLYNFLRDYDLIHCFDYSYDLLYFLLNGKFYDWKMQNHENAHINKSIRKDINTDFYEGFNGSSNF